MREFSDSVLLSRLGGLVWNAYKTVLLDFGCFILDMFLLFLSQYPLSDTHLWFWCQSFGGRLSLCSIGRLWWNPGFLAVHPPAIRLKSFQLVRFVEEETTSSIHWLLSSLIKCPDESLVAIISKFSTSSPTNDLIRIDGMFPYRLTLVERLVHGSTTSFGLTP